MKECKKSHIMYALAYADGSGNRMKIEIDLKEKEQFQCKINDYSIYCSLDDLIWLRDAISEALCHIGKEPKK